ncbi:MAG: hypothetical protein ABI574_04715 [Burkholderiales bacterium]
MITTPTNFERTAAWLAACGKTPNPDGLSTQIGCHLEEMTEFLDTITLESSTGITSAAMQEVSAVLKSLADNIKKGYAKAVILDREAALDALVDMDVTGNGVAYMAGFNKPEGDRRVLDANDDKMNQDGTPVILLGGKIGKREGWAPADLSDLV